MQPNDKKIIFGMVYQDQWDEKNGLALILKKRHKI
jgi:hypothetical protein